MIINDLDGYYIVFDTKNWNTELDTLVYNTYSEIQKEELKSYICQYSNGDLEYNEQERKFKINDDTDLRLLLFGMQMRFYKQPLNDEVQVATSTTSIRNLK